MTQFFRYYILPKKLGNNVSMLEDKCKRNVASALT